MCLSDDMALERETKAWVFILARLALLQSNTLFFQIWGMDSMIHAGSLGYILRTAEFLKSLSAFQPGGALKM